MDLLVLIIFKKINKHTIINQNYIIHPLNIYYIKNGPINKDGTFVEEKPLHDRNEVIECLDILFKEYSKIKFSFITNMVLKNEHENVNIL